MWFSKSARNFSSPGHCPESYSKEIFSRILWACWDKRGKSSFCSVFLWEVMKQKVGSIHISAPLQIFLFLAVMLESPLPQSLPVQKLFMSHVVQSSSSHFAWTSSISMSGSDINLSRILPAYEENPQGLLFFWLVGLFDCSLLISLFIYFFKWIIFMCAYTNSWKYDHFADGSLPTSL